MSDENPGRARGRARGKARGQTQDQTRRPGQETVAAAPPAGAPPSAVHPGGNGGGRKTHRGVPRTDPIQPVQPDAPSQLPQLTQGMSSLGIESGGRGRSRPTHDEYAADNTRPEHITDKKGTSGTPLQLVANFFELTQQPKWCVYQYHVDFAPVVESSRMRRIFMNENRANIGGPYLFDGMSDLKTVRKLPDQTTEFFATRRTDDCKIRITLKLVNELAPTHPELGRLFNTQMRKNLQHLKYQLLGRYYFDQSAISEIPQYNLQIWQGVITSIRMHEEKLMMCVDTISKVVRKETALRIIEEVVQKCRGGDARDEVSKKLVGQIVMTNYNNRTYLIEDIDWTLNPSKTFETKEGPISYVQYYKKQYDININDHKQPLMLCKSKEREIRRGASMQKNCYLVPELCCMTGLTDDMRANYSMMRELANTTKLDPSKRVVNLNTFINKINTHPEITKEMNEWGLRFAKNLVSFNGRIMPREKICQGSYSYDYDQKTGDFSREMRGKAMHVPMNLHNWIVICTKRDLPTAQDFLTHLNKVCPPMGMKVNNPILIPIETDRINLYLQAFKDNFQPNNTSLVCFIVPNNKKERYDALKKHTCLENAVVSQVIVARTLSKKQMLMSVATKIGIQMNAKLGGEPWAVEIPFKMRIMIIGYDTYHDSAKKGRSAGGFVASLNQNLTRWYSTVSFHSSGFSEELSNYVKINFTKALKQYQNVNKCLPDSIIYYRDGVGDGQIRYVMDLEVKPFEEVINSTMAGRNTRFAFIVVNKKINPRFFTPVDPGRNVYTNPPAGTVVDNTVTRTDRYDFFLVSQSVRQGTVAPTMYNVIRDFSNLKPEYMQRLSYKLTHLYFNWPGTIRVPAPCQYAHKLAFLAGQHLHQEPHPSLCDKLFYL